MLIKEVFESVDVLINKEQTGGVISPDQKTTIAKMVDNDFFIERYGLPEDYRPGMPLSAQGYEVTTQIKDALRKVKKIVKIPRQDGGFQIPNDYVHYTAIDYHEKLSCKDDEFRSGIDIVADDKWSARLKDYLTKPDLEYPVGRFDKAFIQVEPKDVLLIRLHYLHKPESPVYAVSDVDEDDNPIFDEENSVDFVWEKKTETSWCMPRFFMLQTHLQNPRLLETANKLKMKGA